jgi:hypothetical protein
LPSREQNDPGDDSGDTHPLRAELFFPE